MMKPKKCVICDQPMDDGWSHNAQPYTQGRCCMRCNSLHVIPAKIAQLYQKRLEEERDAKS